MKILQVALGNQFDIREAFSKYGDVFYYDWSHRDRQFNQDIRGLTDKHKPDLIWLQIQTPNILSPDTARYIASKAKVVNWTGDVRTPLPQWFIDIGKHIHLTLFTNMHDVNQCRMRGVKADYLQIGFPPKIFKPEGLKRPEADIIFMGNNVGSFPLSGLRKQMVERLTIKYGNKFRAYGINWRGYGSENNQEEEAKIYRGCKIAINLSHFDYSRYSSDRIFRIMGAGAFCLSHNYRDIGQEFETGKHLDTWNDLNDLTNKIDHWLANPIQREIIAAEGCEHVHKNHNWNNRIEQLMKMI